MNELLSRPLLLLLLSIFALTGTGFLISDVPQILIENSKKENSKTGRISTASFDIIDQALKETVAQNAFTYTGDFENPFRDGGGGSTEQNSNMQNKKPPEVERIKLLLKGILSKDKPLAILENVQGVTYIRGIGESADSQTVSAINGNTVTITDKKGKYDIVVEEE